jgi:ubiquinone/menaquinone biosynthesis C-methylase UbiE
MIVGETEWRAYWEKQSQLSGSDFEFDRGTTPRASEIEDLSDRELLDFIKPESADVILDAGCGSGANILLLHDKVNRITGIDYSDGAVERCKRRLRSGRVSNVDISRGDVTNLSLANHSVDKILCMSVMQYLADVQVRAALGEFHRVLKPGGVLILHVKNVASLYLATLWAMKKAKLLLKRKTKLEHFRTYRWYVTALRSAGFNVIAYNSFNVLLIEGLPRRMTRYFQKLELKYRNRLPLRLAFVRRHGADLKLKATTKREARLGNPQVPVSVAVQPGT